MLPGREREWITHDSQERKKRHRTEQAPSLQAQAESEYRDCYQEILDGYLNDQVRNSWLKQIVHFSFSTFKSVTTTHGQSSIPTLQQQLLQSKRRLWPSAERCAEICGTSPNHEFAHARRHCNPMEPLGEGRARGMNQMFMNRAAIKLANIDAILEFQLTNAHGEDFLFVDLCGAPGGFSEYIMRRMEATRTSGSCRGYGMSLVGTNEHGNGAPWKLHQISHRHGAFQTDYRVSGGADGTGDIYKWENVMALVEGIKHDLQSSSMTCRKAHLVMADGGFDAQRDSECQEALAQKLIICEMAAGLVVLDKGGIMILKMFGFQTLLIRTAMKSMSDYFDGITVLKPISSRPASSERYVVFHGFRGLPHGWDGPSWMNSVFLGSAPLHLSDHYLPLERYLDESDHDILDLNLKACFAILSALDRRASTQGGRVERDFPPLNIDMYKSAWRLY